MRKVMTVPDFKPDCGSLPAPFPVVKLAYGAGKEKVSADAFEVLSKVSDGMNLLGATRELGLNYGNMWCKCSALDKSAGGNLMQRRGVSTASGTTVDDDGAAFVGAYLRWEDEAVEFAERRFSELVLPAWERLANKS